MAFTSETMLKFGSDAIEFAVTTLLSYNLINEKAGAFNYRRKENITVTGLFSNRESQTPIEEHFRQIKLLLESNNQFVDLQINDLSYGKARILSYDFPTSVQFDQNSVRFTTFTMSMEIFKDDSSGAYADSNLPSAVSVVTDDWYKIKNFTESISFDIQQDKNFLVSHRVAFGVDNIDKDTSENVVSFANGIANQFFAQGLDSLSDIRSLYSSTSFQVSNTDYGSSLINQEADIINYNFSYSKNYTVFSDNQSNTSQTLITELSFGENGVIQVTERGRIKGKGNDLASARQNAITKLEENLANAYSNRCNTFFQNYFSTYYSNFQNLVPNYNASDVLYSNPVSITKDLSGFESEVGYSVTFTTNADYSNSTRIHSFTVDLEELADGIVNTNIKGNVRYYTSKNVLYDKVSDLKTNIIDTTASDLTLISPYFKKVKDTNNDYAGVRTSTDISYEKFGVSANYTKNYSNAPSLSTDSNLITSLVIDTSTQNPVNRFSTTNIPKGDEVIYQTRQLTEGSRSLNLKMTVNREQLYATSGNGQNQNPSHVFSKLAYLFSTSMLHKTSGYLMGTNNPRLLNIFSRLYNEGDYEKDKTTFFMDSLQLSIDSSYNLTVNSGFKFLVRKEK